MSKRIIALIISFVLGLISTPTILSNADDFTPSVVAFDSPKTEEIIEVEPEPEPVSVSVSEPVRTVAPAAPNASVAQPVINYTVTRFVGSRQEYKDTHDKLSYSDIYRYNNMVYGHNSSNLLGNLDSLGLGAEFTITEGGVTTRYRVTGKQRYSLDDLAVKQDNNKTLMTNIADSALGHTVAVMTCSGASHRLVVFADAM